MSLAIVVCTGNLAFPLMYLPACCGVRVSDIWRSFEAQRIAWANGWSVPFHEPTMRQDRNEHDLPTDFEEEIPGYLGNAAIRLALMDLELEAGVDRLCDNLMKCYDALIARGWLGARETTLVRAWVADVRACRTGVQPLGSQGPQGKRNVRWGG